VIIETVGVGQDEIAVAGLADLSIVVLVPGAGDDVQTLKAGIMEVGDILVVNKADHADAERTASSLLAALSLDPRPEGQWTPPVVRTIATTGEGMPALVDAIQRFRATTGAAKFQQRRRARVESEMRDLLSAQLLAAVEESALQASVDRVLTHEQDPHHAARALVAKVLAASTVAGASTAVHANALDHIGIAVENASELLEFLARAVGLTADTPEEVSSQRVRVRFVHAGDVSLEVIEPTSSDSTIARFLASRGPGLHHIAFRVDDLAATLTSLKARGVRLIDHVPRPGAHGTAIAFIHPASADGVLVELVAKGSGTSANR
jgi:LAO/AO transport system kinase